MPTKLSQRTYPNNSNPEDFKCFGPPATKDTEFSGTRLAEMGCFNQEGVDSNKVYLCCVAQHKSTGKWYVYVTYGRQGAGNFAFQFTECSSESEAQSVYEKQCAEKNTKRGEWSDLGGRKCFIPRMKKDKSEDLYVVRNMTSRNFGLPDGKNICDASALPASKVVEPKKGKKIAKVRVDQYTLKLLQDLGKGVVAFTRSSMTDNSLPALPAIDEAKQILAAALQRIADVGDKLEDQVADKQLINLTKQIYGRIPKKKELHSEASTWILSANNINAWQLDLDAFASALDANSSESQGDYNDPLESMNLSMEWLSPEDPSGKFIRRWMPDASRNVHANMGRMNILNVWRVEQKLQSPMFSEKLQKVDAGKFSEKCLGQPASRDDLGKLADRYKASNTNMLFHGSRSVNIGGILKERLRLPAQLVGVKTNGALIGPGLYWADDWRKSAQYVSLPNSLYSKGDGMVSGRKGFMFVADVIIGNPHVAKEGHGYTSAPSGYHSVMGKGGFTSMSWGKLQNNEWVVYEASQHQMRYLVEFDTVGRW